jgi:hypothetical protein
LDFTHEQDCRRPDRTLGEWLGFSLACLWEELVFPPMAPC